MRREKRVAVDGPLHVVYDPSEDINRWYKHNNYYLFIWLFVGSGRGTKCAVSRGADICGLGCQHLVDSGNYENQTKRYKL
jgi:hypothetical protein